MTQITSILPYFDEDNREYVLSTGQRMSFPEYWAWCADLRRRSDIRDAEIHCKYLMQVQDSVGFLTDLGAGYSLSTAASRAFRRKGN